MTGTAAMLARRALRYGHVARRWREFPRPLLGPFLKRPVELQARTGVRAFAAAQESENVEEIPVQAGEFAEKKALVLPKRLPEDFVETTLMPHIEAQLLDSVHVYNPAELAKIARVYAKQENRQSALCHKLADTVKFRMDAFEAVDIMDILGPMMTLTPLDDSLFEAFGERIKTVVDQFTALNLIGLIRVYKKRPVQNNELLALVVPRLRELLRDYEGMELSEMLVSIAQAREAQKDMDILGTIVPEIQRRYREVSLMHSINNLWALSQLKVIHTELLDMVAEDLNNPKKTKDLTPSYMCRVVWIYRMCNSWDKISGALLPLIKSTAAEFRYAEFARLSQALPEDKVLLRQIAGVLIAQIEDMGRKDWMLFFLGCVHGEILEEESKALEDPTSIVARSFEYLRDEQDNFKRSEVEKIVYLLKFAPRYKHLVDELPASWNSTKESTLTYILAKTGK